MIEENTAPAVPEAEDPRDARGWALWRARLEFNSLLASIHSIRCGR